MVANVRAWKWKTSHRGTKFLCIYLAQHSRTLIRQYKELFVVDKKSIFDSESHTAYKSCPNNRSIIAVQDKSVAA